MKLTDLASLERWRALEQAVADRFPVGVNVFDREGKRITDFMRWANDLCPAVKATDKGQSYICAVAHMNLSAQAQQTGRPVIEACDAGFAKLVVPIVYQGRFIGAVGACGCLEQGEEVDDFLVEKVAGIDADTARRLAASTPCLDREQLDALVATIERELADLLPAEC